MDDVNTLYNDGKLLVRAMDWPLFTKGVDGFEFDCSTWVDEFRFLMDGCFSSVSSTLIVPGVGVSTYKSIGFLVNSDLAECFHISKSDSCSSGNIMNGDFSASVSDFQTISELRNYIRTSKDTTMNEVNFNASIESVVGLAINKCSAQDKLLTSIYIVKKCLFNLTGIDYPIYLYDSREGKLDKIDLTSELEQQIIENLKTTKYYYWIYESNEKVVGDVNVSHSFNR